MMGAIPMDAMTLMGLPLSFFLFEFVCFRRNESHSATRKVRVSAYKEKKTTKRENHIIIYIYIYIYRLGWCEAWLLLLSGR